MMPSLSLIYMKKRQIPAIPVVEPHPHGITKRGLKSILSRIMPQSPTG
jgi:DNA topoisomerase VI subunit B